MSSTSLVGPTVAAVGGAAILGVSARWAGLESGPAAVQLTVALQIVGVVLLLVAAAFCGSRWQLDGSATGLFVAVALVLHALGTTPLASLVESLAPGPSGAVRAELVGLLVTAAVVSLGLSALSNTGRRATPHRVLALRLGAGLGVGAAVLVVVDRGLAVAFAPDLARIELGVQIGTCVLWLALAGALWARRSLSVWARRGALVAPGLVLLAALEAARGAAGEGGAVHLAAVMLGACLSAIVCWCALLSFAEAVSTARVRARAVARKLDEATEKVLARDAWREELRHDAVNSITGLRAALSVLTAEEALLAGPTRRKLLEAALTETTHLEHLVVRGAPDLLDAFDVVEVVSAVAAARGAGGLEVSVTADVRDAPGGGPGEVRAQGCPGDFAAVLHNLLHNVRHHAPGSRVTVEVTQAPDQVLVSVTDDGPGIDDAVRHEVFDRGVRGPRSSGTGLGLYVARRLMRGMGGDLELAPSPVGCRVRVVVPAASTASSRAADGDGDSRWAA